MYVLNMNQWGDTWPLAVSHREAPLREFAYRHAHPRGGKSQLKWQENFDVEPDGIFSRCPRGGYYEIVNVPEVYS